MTYQKKQCIGITSKHMQCKKNAIFNSCYCTIHNKKYILNVSKPPTNIKNREKDNAYCNIKDIQMVMGKEPMNQAGLLKKRELFGFDKCFITHRTNMSKGDHGYAIREYYKVTKCYGLDNDWNCLPVDSSINSNYKLFTFKDGTKKDIGYQLLNKHELAELKEEHDLGIKPNGYVISRHELYCKFREWYDYLDSRQILYYLKDDEKLTAFVERHSIRYKKMTQETYKDMYHIFGKNNKYTNQKEESETEEEEEEEQQEEDIDDLIDKFQVVELK